MRPARALKGLGIPWIAAAGCILGCGLGEVGTAPDSDGGPPDSTLQDALGTDDSAHPADAPADDLGGFDASPNDEASDVAADGVDGGDVGATDATSDVTRDALGDAMDATSDGDGGCTGVLCNSQCVTACAQCPGQPALCLATNHCQPDCGGCDVITCLVCADGGPATGGALVCDRNLCIGGGYAHCSCGQASDCLVSNQTCGSNVCATCGEAQTDMQDCEQGTQGCVGKKQQQCSQGLETCMCH